MDTLKPLLVRIVIGILTYGLGAVLASGLVLTGEQKAWLTGQVGPLGETIAGLILIAAGAIYGWRRHKANAEINVMEGKMAKAVTRTPPAVLLLLLPVLALGGCMGGHAFQMEAPKALIAITAQLDTGIDEYHSAETKLIDAAEARARGELQTRLAEYVLKVAAAGGKATVEEAKLAIAPAFAEFDKDMAAIGADRKTENDRWRNMLELTEFARRVAGQIIEIETLRYATYDELRNLARQAIQVQTGGGK